LAQIAILYFSRILRLRNCWKAFSYHFFNIKKIKIKRRWNSLIEAPSSRQYASEGPSTLGLRQYAGELSR